jgi:hypothetical protein
MEGPAELQDPGSSTIASRSGHAASPRPEGLDAHQVDGVIVE